VEQYHYKKEANPFGHRKLKKKIGGGRIHKNVKKSNKYRIRTLHMRSGQHLPLDHGFLHAKVCYNNISTHHVAE